MTDAEPLSISIQLSAAQIDDVVRAAARSRAPSVSTLIADALHTPLSEDTLLSESEQKGSLRRRTGEHRPRDRSALRAAVQRLSGPGTGHGHRSSDKWAAGGDPGSDGEHGSGSEHGPGSKRESSDDRGLRENADRRLSRSLLRGLSILTCFESPARSRGIVEMASELGMSPSTTHRYALTLVELGLLERCPDTRKYRLPARVRAGAGKE